MLNIEELRIELERLTQEGLVVTEEFNRVADKLKDECEKIVAFQNRVSELMDDDENDELYGELDELSSEARDAINIVGAEHWAHSYMYGGLTRWESSMC